MKRNSKWVTWILALLSPILCGIVYPMLPDEIPTNWGFDGTVAYSDKWNLIVIALMPPVLALLFIALPKLDPRRKNYVKFQKYYDFFCIFMMVFLLVLNLVIISESFYPGKISVSTVVILLVGVLFLFLGNMMPKFKSNFFVGLKNPWTLSNPDVWNKTHRLGGIMMFFTGLFCILTCFWIPEKIFFWIFMGLIMVSVLVPSVFSYIWYKKLPAETKNEEEDE